MIRFWQLIKDDLLLKAWFVPLTLVIGGMWTLFLFMSSNKHERDNNELLNQPKFKFFDAMNSHCEIKRSCDMPESSMRPLPDFCYSSDCDRLHWFDIKNDGNFPAEDITISIVLEGESDFGKRIDERKMKERHLQAQESLQYSTNPHDIPDSFYANKKKSDKFRFYVFVQYKSGYSKYWYKRVYQINANKVSRNVLPEIRVDRRYQDGVWARGVVFYSMSEYDCKCQKDVSIIRKVDAFRKKGRQRSLEQYASSWVNDFSGLSTVGQLVDRRISSKK